jgi:hypothetical protein
MAKRNQCSWRENISNGVSMAKKIAGVIMAIRKQYRKIMA